MEISNINGSNAYTANSSTQTAGNASLENKKTQNPEDTQKPATSPSSQQAFQVNITQEAQDMLAAKATPPPAQTTRSDNDSDDGSQNQRPDAAQQARQIINIVA
ncbi:MAG: hypothetical protein KKC20_06760 [Proteobacteria bacterium]|nr:hypothetical protein [Pseudomonadota bacterium]